MRAAHFGGTKRAPMRCKRGNSRHNGNSQRGRERTMANDPFNSFEVPTQMRQLAEQSLEQARKAVDGFMM